MYNPELEGLIDAALADGVLTEKEKQILFKKAQAMGVDLDEFEMVLDARLVKLKKAEEEKAASSAPKSNKLGDVKKCPACGAMVQSYQGKCPECGYAFEGVDANSAVKELSNLLQKEYRADLMMKVIDNYPVPMEKNSLLAFVTWLRPQSTDTNNILAKSYFKKYAECINKIKVSFANDKELSAFIGYFDDDKKSIKKEEILDQTVRNIWFWIGLVVLVVLVLILKPKPLNKDPEKTTAAIIAAVEKGDLSKAEELHANYKGYKSEIKQGTAALCKAYINNNQLDKAEMYVDGTNLGDEIFYLYLRGREYDKADKFMSTAAANSGDDVIWLDEGMDNRIEKTIQIMCENGDKKQAIQYLEGKKTMMKEASVSYYGNHENEGEKKYNERIKQVNQMIESY